MKDKQVVDVIASAHHKAIQINNKKKRINNEDIDELTFFIENELERQGISYEEIYEICFKFSNNLHEFLIENSQESISRGGKSAGVAEVSAQKISSDDGKKIKSPFRFIALNRKVAIPETRSPELDQPVSGGFSGSLGITWAVETPLLIGNEVTEAGRREKVAVPLQLATEDGDDYVIPGASLRGMIRAATEIVAHGRLAQIDGHLRFGLRDFTHPRMKPKDEADAPLAAKNIKAGWLRRSGTGDDATYTITPCDWGAVMVHDLPVNLKKDADEIERWAEWLGMPVAERYRALRYPNHQRSNMVEGDKNEAIIDFSKTPKWSFELKSNSKIPKLYKIARVNNGVSGCFVFSNEAPSKIKVQKLREIDAERKKNKRGRPGQPKEREYVFFGEKALEKFDVRPEDWAQFERINTKPAKNKRVPDGSWASLAPSLNNGGRVPVFYVERQGGIELGLTRFFKIAHEHDVGTIRDRTSSHERLRLDEGERLQPDLVESLFGYVYEPTEILSNPNGRTRPGDIARRGRVSFGMAYLRPDTPAEIWPSLEFDPIKTVQGAPRASFAPFYLSGTIKDYSSPQSTLAGRKRYIPQTRVDQKSKVEAKVKLEERLKNQITRLENSGNTRDSSRKTKVSEEIKSRLRFLVPKTDGEDLIFTSEIRLHNVTAVEVGALLWVLTHGGDHDKPYRHMIGRAKPFGAGQLRVKDLTLRLKGHDAKADEMLTAPELWELPSGSDREGWTGEGGQSMAPFLRAFDEHMKTRLGEELEANAVVREFLAASDPKIGAALAGANRMDYPDLKDFNALRKISKLSTGTDGGPTLPERFLGMDLAVDKMVMVKRPPEPRPIRLPYNEIARP